MVKSWYDKTCWVAVSGLTVKEAVADLKAFCCSTVPEMEISNNVRCAISGMIKQLKILKPAAQIKKIFKLYIAYPKLVKIPATNLPYPPDEIPLSIKTCEKKNQNLFDSI